MVLELNKAEKYYGSNKKADLVSPPKHPKDNNLVDNMGRENIGRFFLLCHQIIVCCPHLFKEGELQEHFRQNLKFALLSKKFSDLFLYSFQRENAYFYLAVRPSLKYALQPQKWPQQNFQSQ